MSIAISKKKIVGLVLASMLAAVSGAACAQSAEYRQGYDQGYRDAMEAQSHREHEHEHDGQQGRIIIEEARYGVRDGGACDARDALQSAIGWRRHFDIPVGNELCGDPARGQPKHLHVRYRCGDSQSVHAEAPEGAIIALSCQ